MAVSLSMVRILLVAPAAVKRYCIAWRKLVVFPEPERPVKTIDWSLRVESMVW